MKSGIIVINKEPGFTSFDVVAKMRGILGIKKIGHTGTLDPEATGVLPICIGKATKVCDLLTDKDKTYICTMELGKTSDTLDAFGEILTINEVDCCENEVINAINSFKGDIMQIPPMYSALKVNGKKLYELARAGVEVERKARPVTIYDIEILNINIPFVEMKISCSKGTYIRSLCDDIGSSLGCGAIMTSLCRTNVASFDIDSAITLAELESLKMDNKIEDVLIPIYKVFPYVHGRVSDLFSKNAVNGAKIPMIEVDFLGDVPKEDDRVNLFLNDGAYLGVYTLKDNMLVLEKMFYE